jgi:hypothetical protein
LEKLEEVSYLLKGTKEESKTNSFLKLHDSRNYKDFTDSITGYVEKMEQYFPKPKTGGEEEEEAPEEMAPVGNVPDLMVDSKIFEWAGIGFGEMENYRLMMALKKLVGEKVGAS